MRIKIFRLIVVVLFLLITLDLIYIQLIKGPYFYNLSKNNRIRTVAIEGERGRIFDRHGVVLADNRRAFDVMVVPQGIEDQDELFDFLSKTLEVDKKKLQKVYRQKAFGSFAPVAVAEDISREKTIILEENKFRFPGLYVQESFRRFYPPMRASSHVLGYVRKISPEKLEALRDYGYTHQSVVGETGVEESYDRYLKGHSGGLQLEVNSRGEQVRLLSMKEPLRGRDITLTIDHRIQQIAAELLAERAGAIIVMDMNSGEILGLVSSPSFDPNVFIEKNKRSAQDIFADRRSPLLNRAISGQYPPGSAFKIPVALCALDARKINSATTFNCPGYFKLGGKEFQCPHAHGDQNLIEAIAHSCNVYFFHAGLMVGSETIQRYARLLGLGSSSGIDLPSEGKGFIPGRQQRRWYGGDTLNLAIGQGDVLATPLQLVRMISIVAQNGRDVHPHVVKAVGSLDRSSPEPFSLEDITDPQVKIKEYLRSQIIHINNGKFFEALQAGLRAGVSDPSGTGSVLNIPNLLVSGKTGTAQTTKNRDHHAWFVGFCPSSKVNIAFCVFLEHGGSSYNACVVARDLLLRMQAEGIL
ncbi:MAG TPA: penicillin-binding protein 2 [Candidatus Omnitrophota bacterium]|nr:penicillin-binding protein 2 [Candidatus Omnitrophota bacterium]